MFSCLSSLPGEHHPELCPASIGNGAVEASFTPPLGPSGEIPDRQVLYADAVVGTEQSPGRLVVEVRSLVGDSGMCPSHLVAALRTVVGALGLSCHVALGSGERFGGRSPVSGIRDVVALVLGGGESGQADVETGGAPSGILGDVRNFHFDHEAGPVLSCSVPVDRHRRRRRGQWPRPHNHQRDPASADRNTQPIPSRADSRSGDTEAPLGPPRSGVSVPAALEPWTARRIGPVEESADRPVQVSQHLLLGDRRLTTQPLEAAAPVHQLLVCYCVGQRELLVSPQTPPTTECLVPYEPIGVEDRLQLGRLGRSHPKPVAVTGLYGWHPRQHAGRVRQRRACGPSGALPPTAEAVGFLPPTRFGDWLANCRSSPEDGMRLGGNVFDLHAWYGARLAPGAPPWRGFPDSRSASRVLDVCHGRWVRSRPPDADRCLRTGLRGQERGHVVQPEGERPTAFIEHAAQLSLGKSSRVPLPGALSRQDPLLRELADILAGQLRQNFRSLH